MTINEGSIRTRRIIDSTTGQIRGYVATAFGGTYTDESYFMAASFLAPGDKFNSEIGKSLAISRLLNADTRKELKLIDIKNDILKFRGTWDNDVFVLNLGRATVRIHPMSLKLNHRALTSAVYDYMLEFPQLQDGNFRV